MGRVIGATGRSAWAALEQAWPRVTHEADLAQPGDGDLGAGELVDGDAEAGEAAAFAALLAQSYCHRCGATEHEAGVTATGCSNCHGQRIAWQRITRLTAYEPPVSGWVKQMKYQRCWHWARPLGERLADRLDLPRGEPSVVVTAVPMHWRRRWVRGFNQAGLIADALARRGGWLRLDVLRRRRRTMPQALLHAHAKRLANLRRAIEPLPIDLAGCEVVLVDDVVTTRATLEACCRALNAMSAGKPRLIRAAVVAVADGKRRDRGV